MATLEDLIRQKQELEKEIEEVTRRERINAINTCRELIQKFDLQPAEIGLKKLMRKGAMIPKFMGPKGETWTAAAANLFGSSRLSLKARALRISVLLPPLQWKKTKKLA